MAKIGEETISTISDQREQMALVLREINQASQAIDRVIKVIGDIVFQTDVLAFNAAMEAARVSQHSENANIYKGNAVDADVQKMFELANGVRLSSAIVSDIARMSGDQVTALAKLNDEIKETTLIPRVAPPKSEETSTGHRFGQERIYALATTARHLLPPHVDEEKVALRQDELA